jgi:Flp pilus assembly protein TadD
MAEKLIRTASGVWTVDPTSVEAKPPSPSSPSGLRTPSRGLPPAPKDRASLMVELARADIAKGNLSSAETNLRLALTFAPGNREVEAELKRIADTREAERRAKGPNLVIK